ncbi:tetratricopeptide repeat protein [Flavobacteriaceae bacterium 3-367]
MKIRTSTLPVLLALFSTCLSLQSQDGSKTDSLFSLLNKNPHDTTKVDLYLSLHRAFTDDSARAMEHIDKAVALSLKLEDTRRFCQSNLALSHFYYGRGLLSEAQNSLNQVREKLPVIDDQTIASSFYMEQGLVALANGTFENATDSFLKAKRLFEVLGDTVGIGKCHTNLGSVYWTIGNLDKALEHYKKSLDLKHPDDHLGISKVLGNLGLLERAKNNYPQALAYYQRSLNICQENDFKLEAAINLQNIGVVYEKQKAYDTALDYFTRSNALSRSIDDKIGILYTDHGIATLYSNLGAYNQAIAKLYEALAMAEELHIKDEIKNINQSLAETFERLGDYKKALQHQKNFELWKDSIVSQTHLDQVRELEIKYETEKKDRQITFLGQEKELQKKETQRQATLKNTFIGGILLITLLGSLLFYTFRLRVRNQKAMAAKNEEIKEVNFKQKLSELERKALQAQINPHFIFNCMNSINQMILDEDNKNASKYLTKFSKLIRLILENAEDTEVSLKKELSLLESYIELETLRFNGEIKHRITLAEDIDVENIQLPGMVLQPFVENAIWHGLRHKKGKDGGQISISIKKNSDQLICQIEDNGVGRQKAFEMQQKSVWKGKSMGVKITEERLRLLSKELKKQLIRITDLKDGSGKARGTLVEVHIPIS